MELDASLYTIPWGELEQQLHTLYPEWNYSLTELGKKVLEGNGLEAIGELWGQVLKSFVLEWESMKMFFLTIVMVVLLSAVFSTFKDAFGNPQISQVSFYINYLILTMILIRLFQSILDIGEAALQNIEEFMRIFFPTYFMTVGVTGGVSTGLVYYQLACVVIYIVELVLKMLLLPCISSYMLFVLINGIWGEEKLDLLLELWKKAIKTILKLILGVLTGAAFIQSLITPVIDRLKGETVIKTVEAIPGVGELAEGAIRVALGSAVLIKNSIGIVSCILLLTVSFLPLVKIAATGCLLKVAAALLGLAADKRMVQCTDCVGDGILLLLQTIGYGILLFFVLIAITSYTTSGGF